MAKYEIFHLDLKVKLDFLCKTANPIFKKEKILNLKIHYGSFDIYYHNLNLTLNQGGILLEQFPLPSLSPGAA